MQAISSSIKNVLRNVCRIQHEDLVIVGVSGGIDSVFLLTQLHELKQPMIAAVFDHGLRPESAEECAFVMAYCRTLGIPCVQGSGDVRNQAEKTHSGIEATARELRYRFLFETAEQHLALAVVTAHHANDRAETVLLHLLRGAGIDGLSGMRPYTLPNAFSKTIPLIRPLLGISRTEIETYMAENSIPFRDDISNNDREYTRNRIRLDLIPQLEQEYNPRIVQSLCRLAETASEDAYLLNEIAESTAKYIGVFYQDDRIEWGRKAYIDQPYGLRMRMLRLFFSKLDAENSDIGYHIFKQADDFFLNARYNQTMPVFGEILLRCEGNTASIVNQTNFRQWKYPQLSQGWELAAETIEITEKELPYWMEQARKHPEMAVLDANQLASWPVLRTVIQGERFQPYGNRGKSQKVSDFLINNKIPKEFRPDLAVAADDAGIIWIPGFRISNRCALQKGTHRLLILKLANK